MIKTGRKDLENGYTPHSWKGVNYSIATTTKDISKLIRKELKHIYPTCKFSITTSHNEINISLMSDNKTPFEVDSNIDYNLLALKDSWRNAEQLKVDYEKIRQDGHLQVNHFHIQSRDLLNAEAKKLFTKIKDLLDSFNYDDSDMMTDYFSTKFYINLAIGRWDKRFIVE